jgi:DNA polymerase III alpha subunit (gram-positive type)
MSLIIVHDTETDGFSDVDNIVTEYAAVAFDAEIEQPIGFFSVLIDHGRPIPQKITELTGIDNALLQKYGVKPDVAVKRILAFHKRYEIDYFMAHNEPFDRKMVQALTKEKLNPKKGFICTQRDFEHNANNNKLGTLSEHYKINHGFAHRAMTDTMACLAVGLKAGLLDFLGKPSEEKVEVRIKVPYGFNDQARMIGFYWSGNNTTKHHYRKIKKSQLNEVLEQVKKNKFQLLETVGV